MKARHWAILIVIFSTFITASAQFFLKTSSETTSFNLSELISNYPLILGCILYGVGAILLIISLKHGELSVVYPFYSLSYIWVTYISLRFLGETVNAINWVGALFIVSGVIFIGVGSEYQLKRSSKT